MNNLFHVTDAENTYSVLTVQMTEAAKEMQRVHTLSKTGSRALSELLTAAALLSTMLVQNETLTLTADGVYESGTAVAVADAEGKVRGFFREYEKEEAKPTPMLKVMRRAGLKEPRMSYCLLDVNSLENSLTEYYRTSQQMDALCRLQCKFKKGSEELEFVGGIFVLPWAKTQSVSAKTVRQVLSETNLQTFLKKVGQSPMHKAFPEETFLVKDEKCAEYHCNCSFERMQSALLSIGEVALSELLEDEYTLIHCDFCDQKYIFSRESIQDLIETLQNGEK